VTYVGGHGGGVNVQLEVGSYVFADHSGPVDLPDDIADELVDRGEFVYASAASESGAPAKSAGKDDWAAYRMAQGHDVEGLTKDELVALPDTAPEG
jgi:hypothetical protein